MRWFVLCLFGWVDRERMKSEQRRVVRCTRRGRVLRMKCILGKVTSAMTMLYVHPSKLVVACLGLIGFSYELRQRNTGCFAHTPPWSVRPSILHPLLLTTFQIQGVIVSSMSMVCWTTDIRGVLNMDAIPGLPHTNINL